MHELAVTQNILDVTLRYAQGQPVVAIHLVVGELSSMMDDSVQFYWDTISQGTLAEGAVLHFERIAAQFRCRICGASYGLHESALICPVCGGSHVELLQGNEFYVSAIDVEDRIDNNADPDTCCREHPERQ